MANLDKRAEIYAKDIDFDITEIREAYKEGATEQKKIDIGKVQEFCDCYLLDQNYLGWNGILTEKLVNDLVKYLEK